MYVQFNEPLYLVIDFYVVFHYFSHFFALQNQAHLVAKLCHEIEHTDGVPFTEWHTILVPDVSLS